QDARGATPATEYGDAERPWRCGLIAAGESLRHGRARSRPRARRRVDMGDSGGPESARHAGGAAPPRVPSHRTSLFRDWKSTSPNGTNSLPATSYGAAPSYRARKPPDRRSHIASRPVALVSFLRFFRGGTGGQWRAAIATKGRTRSSRGRRSGAASPHESWQLHASRRQHPRQPQATPARGGCAVLQDARDAPATRGTLAAPWHRTATATPALARYGNRRRRGSSFCRVSRLRRRAKPAVSMEPVDAAVQAGQSKARPAACQPKPTGRPAVTPAPIGRPIVHAAPRAPMAMRRWPRLRR